MCGIAGFVVDGRDPQRQADVLLSELSNRGPDGGWWELKDGICLVQTRLAIVDLSERVRYPMPNERGDVHLLFNGEIYNHEELRRRLEGSGHRFATRCDAEVVVHGYEEWGTDVFARLNGMYGLAIADQRTGELVLARDPMGIKPLFMTTGKAFAFSSDAMSLVAAGLAPGRIDHRAIAEYAAFHYVPAPASGIQGIEQVAPGTFVRRRRDGTRDTTAWRGPVFDVGERRAPVELDEADHILRGAVERQLKADVEVGVFLSGGVDSALVLDYAVELGARPMAFTVSFSGFGDYDEADAARRLATRLGVPHEVEVLSAGFEETMSEVARAYDTPLADESAIATLPLSRLARRHVTVALSGTGGDDLFAGYYRHRARLLERLVRLIPPDVARRIADQDPGRGSERASIATLARAYAARLARLRTSGATGAEHFLMLVGSSTSPAGLAALREEPDQRGARDAVMRRLGLAGTSLDDVQNFDLRTYLPGCILVKEDRATMAHSLEGRVPLLDEEMIALAARTPAGQRATLRSGKVLLRQLAHRRMPERQGPKRGFAVPLRGLFEGAWREDAAAWLRNRDSELVDGERAAELIGRADVPPLDLWALCALCAWEERLNDARRGRAAASIDQVVSGG